MNRWKLHEKLTMTDGQVGSRIWSAARALVVFGVSVLLGAGAFFGSAGPSNNVVLAQAESDTYILSEFKIEYPYVDPRSDLEPQADQAIVYYKSYWSGSRFPGLVKCQISVQDAAGTTVGRIVFDLSSASRELPERVASAPIDVTAPPASAEGGCEAGDYPEGSGYTFSRPSFARSTHDATGQSDKDRVAISFDVGWNGVHPSMRTCSVEVQYSDGSTKAFGPFVVHLSHSVPFEVDVPARDVSDVRDADISCGPLRE